MANIISISAINSDDAVLAEPVSNNFSRILDAINSNALDGNNYGESTIKSQHISTNAILSVHLTDGAVVSQKLATEAVIQAHLNFASTDAGVQLVRIGAAASNMPAAGVEMARITGTVSLTDTTVAVTFSAPWANAIEGDPAFTAPPEPMGAPGWVVSNTTASSPLMVWVTAITDSGFTASAEWSVSHGASAQLTYHMGVMGPK